MTFIGAFMLVVFALLVGLCMPRISRQPANPLYVCGCGNVTRAHSHAALEAQHWRLVYGSPCCPHCLDKPAPAHLYEEEDSA